jgi:hypothetical protein
MTTNPPANEPSADPFPGWYSDPLRMARQRFWNGRVWTEETKGTSRDDGVGGPVPAIPDDDDRIESAEAAAKVSKARIFGNSVTKSPASELPSSAIEQEPTNATSSLSSLAEDESAPTVRHAAPSSEIDLTMADRVVADPGRPTNRIGTAASDGAPNSEGHRIVMSAPNEPDAKASVEEVLSTMQTRDGVVDSALPTADVPEPRLVSGSRSEQGGTADIGNGFTTAEAEHPTSFKWLLVLLVGVAALVAGFFVGRLSDGDDDVAGSLASTGSESSLATEAELAQIEETATVEIQAELDSTSAELDSTSAELEAVSGDLDDATVAIGDLTVERDDALAHNALLQTWFRPEVRARSDRDWNGEVTRACAAEDEPTLENTNYSRSMELVGTHNGLVQAIVECRGSA